PCPSGPGTGSGGGRCPPGRRWPWSTVAGPARTRSPLSPWTETASRRSPWSTRASDRADTRGRSTIVGMDTPTTPDSALTRLLDGNPRYVAGQSRHEHQDPDRRAALARRQNPFAPVFTCSDSRSPAEAVVAPGRGVLFVIRHAGHIVDPSVLGSIEFVVDVLSIPLTLVLGHSSCGAVGAAINAVDSHSTPSGYLRDVVERIAPAVFEARRDP